MKNRVNWTNYPSFKGILAIIALAPILVFLQLSPALAQRNYYVSGAGSDASNGTSPQSPKRNPRSLGDRLNPGDTVFYMNGTYEPSSVQEGPLMIIRSGTPGAYITHINYPNHTPVFYNCGNRAIEVRNAASYVNIVGLTVRQQPGCPNPAGDPGMGNHFRGNGIHVGYSTINPFRGDGDPSHHVNILRCDVKGMRGAGIATQRADYLRIEDNRVDSCAMYSMFGESGVTVLEPHQFDQDTAGYRIIIRHNIISRCDQLVNSTNIGQPYRTDGNAIILDRHQKREAYNGGVYWGRTLIAGNLCYGNGGRAVCLLSSVRVHIVNNTFVNNVTGSNIQWGVGNFTWSEIAGINGPENVTLPPGPGIVIANNLIVKNNVNNRGAIFMDGTVPFSLYNNLVRSPVTTINFDGNGERIVQANGVVRMRSVVLRANVGEQTADPLFVAPTGNPATADYRVPPGSPAVDAGRALPGITPGRDLLGNPCPLGAAIDIGAYEQAGGNAVAPNQLPAVRLSTPAANSSFGANPSISIRAEATDADGSVARVEFFRGNVRLGEVVTAPYEYVWNGAPTGTYLLTARATDNAGGSTTSAAVLITVTATAPVANRPPTASLTAPVGGATFAVGNAIGLLADAADADGNVIRVEFFQGIIKLGEVASAPYSFTWTNAPAGSYALTARATDNGGAVTTSEVTNILVNAAPTPTPAPAPAPTPTPTPTPAPTPAPAPAPAPTPAPTPNQLPTVALTAPIAGSSFAAGNYITLRASATDADGSVARVEFFWGTVKLGESLTAPYSVAWENPPTGTHRLTARATDNAGGVTTSVAVSVTVLDPDVAGVTVSGATTFCAGSSVRLGGPTDPVAYAWSNGATTREITVTTAGTYALTTTDAAGNRRTWAGVAITVVPTPAKPTLAYANGLLTASEGFTYRWLRDGQPVAGSARQFTPDAAGRYAVTVANATGCAATSDDVVVRTPAAASAALAGRSDQLPAGELVVYPNPANEFVNLTLAVEPVNQEGTAAAEGTVVLSDSQGREVIRASVPLTGNRLEARLDVSSLRAGMYLVDVRVGNGRVTRRLLKQ